MLVNRRRRTGMFLMYKKLLFGGSISPYYRSLTFSKSSKIAPPALPKTLSASRKSSTVPQPSTSSINCRGQQPVCATTKSASAVSTLTERLCKRPLHDIHAAKPSSKRKRRVDAECESAGGSYQHVYAQLPTTMDPAVCGLPATHGEMDVAAMSTTALQIKASSSACSVPVPEMDTLVPNMGHTLDDLTSFFDCESYWNHLRLPH